MTGPAASRDSKSGRDVAVDGMVMAFGRFGTSTIAASPGSDAPGSDVGCRRCDIMAGCRWGEASPRKAAPFVRRGPVDVASRTRIAPSTDYPSRWRASARVPNGDGDAQVHRGQPAGDRAADGRARLDR